MMIGGAKYFDLKVILKRPSIGNGTRRLRLTNLITQNLLHIKLGRVVDPIKTHMLCGNQKFLHTLRHFL